MKFLLTVIILALLITSCNKNNSDHKKGNSEICMDTTFLPTNVSEFLISIFFLTGQDGFASGYDGGLYKTTDSAKNWTRLNSPVSLPVYSLFFTSPLTGFAAGGKNSCSGTGCVPPGGFILRTLDGGQTWTKVYTPTDKIEITSIYFLNASTGFCIGDNVIIKTLDGGLTWSEHKIDNLGGKMMQIKFISAQKGYIVCLFDQIIITEDGGSTWQVKSPQYNVGYYSISEANGSTYVSGQGKVIKSTNGGILWNELKNSPADIFSINFFDSQNGIALGRGNYSGGDLGYSYGSIYCTNDGGETWNGTAEVKERTLFKSTSFPTNNIGYAVNGNKIVRLTVK